MEMDWRRGQTIGHGSTATVSIATAKPSGEVFAVKSAELSNSEILKREERILSKLVCPQVVAYKGSNISAENGKILYNLFLEYAPGGTLNDVIRMQGGCLEEGRIRSYTRAVLLGLEYLHSNGIVHCDIKGQNILVTNDGAKIADLGCAKRVDEVPSSGWSSKIMPISGTPIYMAPEVARGEDQGFPADVWALGCTVIEMATGRAPWADASDPVSALYRIGFSSDEPEIPRCMSKQAQDFLSKCLMRNPAERWTACELIEHEFVKEKDSLLTEFLLGAYNSETPTSILNQDVWNSTERLETTWNKTRKSCSGSAKERIRQLSEGNKETAVNWAWDATWVTVRINGSKEPEGFLDGNMSSSSAANEVSIIGNGAERISDSEEYDVDILPPGGDSTRFSEINTCNTTSISNSSRRDKSLQRACKCTNDVSCSNHILRNKKILLPNFSSNKVTNLSICMPKAYSI